MRHNGIVKVLGFVIITGILLRALDPKNWNQFAGDHRIHIGFGVADIAASTRFYQTLFDTVPSKTRPGYAKFEPVDPPLNLSLSQRPASAARADTTGAHYGIQVKSPEAVAAAIERFRVAGLDLRVEESTTCCYAVQTKAWVSDPNGNSWEVFVVLDADATKQKDGDSECCPTVAGQAAACCA